MCVGGVCVEIMHAAELESQGRYPLYKWRIIANSIDLVFEQRGFRRFCREEEFLRGLLNQTINLSVLRFPLSGIKPAY